VTRPSREFFRRPADEVAPDLLGMLVVRRLADGQRLAGRIVEVEAYLGEIDRASHAYRGRRTRRNESMYAEGGTAYVYFTYGMHHCFNVVCLPAGTPGAVLVRALEPLQGLAEMRRRRGAIARRDRDLCSGPGKLCRALGVDLALDGTDLTRGRALWVEMDPRAGDGPRPRIVRAARVGVESAGAWARRRLRWLIAESPHVSVRP
jgi:DNA-3-methyladenine glycosylase